jgi:hypothetical protein
MMKTVIALLAALAFVLSLQVDGFSMPARPAAAGPGILTAGRKTAGGRAVVSSLFLAAEDKPKTESKVSADGTYYDDEVSS